MSAEENRAALAEAVANWNAGRYEEYLLFYAPDVVLQGFLPGLPPGREGARLFYSPIWAAYPNSQLTMHATIAEGEMLACRFSLQGVQHDVFMGIPPQGQSIHVGGQTIMRFADSQCVERWNQVDMLGWFQQLGVIATPA
jgi:predicted ester cyclase